MLGAVFLDAEELVWTCSAPVVIRGVFALVCEVNHDPLEWFGFANSSRHVLVRL
jgi:hypothetical protein